MAKKRFIIKEVKTCWRSSMIAGNPITRKFTKYGVYDRDCQNDRCYCFHAPQFVSCGSFNEKKFRIVLDDKETAQKVADKMNALFESIPGCKCIDFQFNWCNPIEVAVKSTKSSWLGA